MAIYNKALSTDTNTVLFEGVYDPVGAQFVAVQAGTVTTDGAGNPSAPQMVTDSAVGTNTAHLYAASGYVALTTPPATTTAGVDTSVTFSSQVHHWLLQNNTSANVAFELDSAASAGSIILAPNATWTSDVPVTVVHLYTAAAQNINGSVAGNIVLRGWL